MITTGDSLRELPQAVLRELLPELRLSDEDDLQEFLLRRLQVCQQAQLFQYALGQVLRLVDEQDRAPPLACAVSRCWLSASTSALAL